MDRLVKTACGEAYVPNDKDYLAIVEDIFGNESVQSMKSYVQHGNTTCLAHSINVSYLSYLHCKSKGLDARSAARAGLLHDLFLYDWHLRPRQKGELLHGFEHPRKALENARKEFELNSRESDIILRHMWPLTLTPPRYPESFVVVFFDKYCSVKESFYLPILENKVECIQLVEN